MSKRVLSILAIVLCSMLVFTGCSNGSTKTEETDSKETPKQAESSTSDDGEDASGEYKLAYSVQNISNTYFVEVARGVQERCDELGIEVIIHDGKSDAANQVTAFENFISQGVNAIICSPVDPVALEPAIESAHDSGIVVVAGNQDIEGRDAFVTVPEYEYGLVIGQAAGKWIADNLDGEAEVAILDYPEIESIIARADGMRDGLLEYAPNAKVVAQQSANNNADGMAAMEAILQSNPNVEVVIGVNDAGALGAYEAMMASGNVDAECMFFGGLDATQEALDAIKDGGIYRATVDIQPYETGRLFVDTAIEAIEKGGIEDTIIIPMQLVDASNIDKY